MSIFTTGRNVPKDAFPHHARKDGPNTSHLSNPPIGMGNGGYSDKIIKVLIIPLDNTFEDRVYQIPGNVLQIPWSTNSNDLIFVRLNDMENDEYPMVRFSFIGGVPFTRVHISLRTAVPSGVLYLMYTTDNNMEHFRAD